MTANQTKILKFGTNYGLLTGFVVVLYTIITVALGLLYDKSITKAFIGLLVLVLPISFSIATFKKQNNNSLSISEALGVGIITALMASLVIIIFTYLLSNFIIDDYWEVSAANSRIALQQQFPKITEDQINDKVTSQLELSWITYPLILLFNAAIGFITSFITGMVLKTKETFR
jgi:hypothetical protein